MTDDPWYAKYIVCDPDILSGTPVISGTRLPAEVVAASVEQGMTIDEVAAAYPSINSIQAEAAVAFIRENPGPHIPAKEPFWRVGTPKFSKVVRYSPIKKQK